MKKNYHFQLAFQLLRRVNYKFTCHYLYFHIKLGAIFKNRK
jgi:hypothetical protein